MKNSEHSEIIFEKDAVQKEKIADLPRAGWSFIEKPVFIKEDDCITAESIGDILYFKALGNYCDVYLADNRKIRLAKKLKEIVDVMPSNFFKKANRSYLINISHIRRIFLNGQMRVIMDNETVITLSCRYKKTFLERIENSFLLLK